jgi:hypothetical protein
MSEVLLNDIAWTLGAAISSTSATTITVAAYAGNSGSLSALASSGSSQSIRIRIDDEIMILTGWATTTFTVVRGAEGTTAATHANGALVYGVFSAGAVNGRLADQNLSNTVANRPAAGSSTGTLGRLYLPTDGVVAYRDDASADADSWKAFGPIYPLISPPTSGWTSTNVGGNAATIVVDYTHGQPSIFASVGAASGENLAILSRAQPSTPYTLTAAFIVSTSPNTGGRAAGIGFHDTVSGKFVSLCLDFANGYPRLAGYSWTNPTTYSGTNLYALSQCDSSQVRFARLVNSGTSLEAWISADGILWYRSWQSNVGTILTPNNIGVFINTGGGQGIGIRLIHWLLT